MESLFKRLLKNQNDVAGVLRGLDKVRQAAMETDYYTRNLTEAANFLANQEAIKPRNIKKKDKAKDSQDLGKTNVLKERVEISAVSPSYSASTSIETQTNETKAQIPIQSPKIEASNFSESKTSNVHANEPEMLKQQAKSNEIHVTAPEGFVKQEKIPEKIDFSKLQTRKTGRENEVPSGSLARGFSAANLGVGLIRGAITTSFKQAFRVSTKDAILSDENAQKIADFLCRMRGAPLKLGQALSMQEEMFVPKPIRDALERAQKSADIMPNSQLNSMLENELGADWRDKFEEFDPMPMAAASIGQVHKARNKNGMNLAVKIQYPGVADSIDSDLNNLQRLFLYTRIIPKELFIEDVIKNARRELKEECNYDIEAQKQLTFRQKLGIERNFYAPQLDLNLSTKRILAVEFIEGLTIEQLKSLSQEVRDRAGELIFRIMLKQLFDFQFIQTDPNPANYLYNPEKDVLNLIDFGAARDYEKDFVEKYLDLVYGAMVHDRKLILERSVQLGFLTGEENRELKEAAVNSVIIVGEPYSANGPFDFGNQDLAKRIYQYMPVMMNSRLKSPPQETYSLHRVLGGAYLLCIQLKARVNVAKIFNEAYGERLRSRFGQNQSLNGPVSAVPV